MLTIGGVNYDAHLRRGTLRHLNALGSEPDTLDFELIAGAPKPPVGAEVLYTLPGGALLFGGIATGAPERHAGLKAVAYAVACSDWRSRADRRVLNDRFQAKTPGAIVAALFAKYAPEFNTSQVDTSGAQIRAIQFKRDSRLTDALDKLAGLCGFVWDIDPAKNVIFKPLGSLQAPIALTDTSRNFRDLSVEVNRDELKNRVIVRGGRYPSNVATADTFTQDSGGLTTNFRLSKTPYGLDQYVVFEDQFSKLDASKWTETDVSNPSPPAGHIPSDGYLFTTLQQGAALAESGWLQIVGGNSTWGAVRLMSSVPQGRGDGGRRFELDVYATSATGQGRFGLWDPNNQSALAGEAWGFFFDNGTIKPSVGGTAQTALATVTYTAGKTVRTRIIPKATTGAVLWVNTDDANGFRSSQWVKLYDSSAGSLANLTIAACFNHSFNGRADRAMVFNRLYNITLTVNGVEKIVGRLNVDENYSIDAVIGASTADVPVLAFFGDTKPPANATVVVTYYEGIPVLVQAQDNASVAALAALEGNDGIYEGYIEDSTLNSLDLARTRAVQELEQYANPLVTITFSTRATGLRSGQVLPVSLTAAASGRDLAGSYLVHQVETQSLGSGNYEATVTAGSRLKGLSEYLRDLLRAGKASEDPADEASPMDELIWASDALSMADQGNVSGPGVTASDSISFTDLGSVTNGPVAPYVYGGPVGFTRASLAVDSATGQEVGKASSNLAQDPATNLAWWNAAPTGGGLSWGSSNAYDAVEQALRVTSFSNSHHGHSFYEPIVRDQAVTFTATIKRVTNSIFGTLYLILYDAAGAVVATNYTPPVVRDTGFRGYNGTSYGEVSITFYIPSSVHASAVKYSLQLVGLGSVPSEIYLKKMQLENSAWPTPNLPYGATQPDTYNIPRYVNLAGTVGLLCEGSGANIDTDGSFEAGVPTITHASDGGGTTMTGPTVGDSWSGSKVLRITDQIGGHSFRFFSKPISGTVLTLQGRVRRNGTSAPWASTLRNGLPVGLEIYLYDETTGANVGTPISLNSTHLGSGAGVGSWYKFSKTFTGLTSGRSYSWKISMSSWVGEYLLDFDGFCREEKPYEQSPCFPARAGESVPIPISNLLGAEGSIIIDWAPTRPQSGVIDQGSSPAIFQLGSYYDNASMTLWAFYQNSSGSEPRMMVFIKGGANSGWSASATPHSSGDGWYQQNTIRRTIVTWTGGSTFYVYSRGVKYGPYNVADPVTSWYGGFLTLPASANVYSSLALLNRAMTDPEIVAAASGVLPPGALSYNFGGVLEQVNPARYGFASYA